MSEVWILASVWISLALVSTFISVWLGIATALSEIIVGMIAQAIIVAYFGGLSLGTSESWITFLAGSGAIVLTFLAGAELDPIVFRMRWKEVSLIGLVAFFAPFFGCAAVAYYFLHWSLMASWLCGVALSTTSVAVVYAVMLELGLNRTEYGKVVLGACFINDLGYEKFFKHLRQEANERSLHIKTEVALGHPAEQIIRWAEKHHVNIIVMGHQTKNTFGRWLLGSTPDKVVHHAPCTVTIVKNNHYAK
jgi:nucleotide-binding universal stress UspA family protein